MTTSGEIKVDWNKAAAVVASLQALSSMASEYCSFSLELSENKGPQVDAMATCASQVASLAVREKELIDSMVNTIIADVAAFKGVDEGLARSMLLPADQGAE